MSHAPAAAHVHGRRSITGILLTNLGTPDAPTPAALRRYLAEFLWDRRVVELPRALWWLILHGIIPRTRPARSARKYATVWTTEGSPLLATGQRQRAALQDLLHARELGSVKVALGMRYGQPSIATALRELREAGCNRLLVLPLYPQYSAATTASTFDAVAAELGRWRWLPELRFITHYHDDPHWVEAVAASIRHAWQDAEPQRLLFSFHGLPERNLLAGDPYFCECHKSARLIAERLALPDERWAVAFQSRFGRAEWLKPYTSATLQQWAQSGVKSVDVICPGFAADCLETLEEIAIENRDLFLAAGGETFRYLPALNAAPGHIAALATLVERHITGWSNPDTINDESLAASRTRALALGASD